MRPFISELSAFPVRVFPKEYFEVGTSLAR